MFSGDTMSNLQTFCAQRAPTEEIELLRQIERVAAQRRALPPGGQIANDFKFISETGLTLSSVFFGDKDTFGPRQKSPCRWSSRVMALSGLRMMPPFP